MEQLNIVSDTAERRQWRGHRITSQQINDISNQNAAFLIYRQDAIHAHKIASGCVSQAAMGPDTQGYMLKINPQAKKFIWFTQIFL